MEKRSRWPDYKREWNLSSNKFVYPDYLEFKEDLKDHFKEFQKAGISKRDLLQAWEKCGVGEVSFLSPARWCPRRGWGEINGMDRAPEGWEERYGTEAGYSIDLRDLEPSKIRAAVKELAKEDPHGWGIKIKPKEFYRVLFFHEVAHTLPICGRFLSELAAMKPEERVKFEQEAWLWAVKMARQKDPKIKILCYSRKKEDKLEHSNYCQWYGLLKRDEEFRKREKAEAMKKAA